MQFSNDVRVELAPQLMPMEQLRAQLGEMVRSIALKLAVPCVMLLFYIVCAHVHTLKLAPPI